MNKLLALSAKTIRRLRMTDKMITPVGSLAMTGNRILGQDDLWLVDKIIHDLRAAHLAQHLHGQGGNEAYEAFRLI
jgi:hypothetical protein